LIFQKNCHTIVGRKVLSNLFLEKKTTGLFCSLISAPMFLGFLKNHSSSGHSIYVDYFPFTDGEKLYVFDEMKKNRQADIFFPYQYKDLNTGHERVSPPENRSFTLDKVESLNYGVEHFR